MKSPPPMSYYGADVLANFVKEAEGMMIVTPNRFSHYEKRHRRLSDQSG
jgi:hypothetical protein